MKKLTVLFLMMLPMMADDRVHREDTEWCDIWVPKATDQKLPRVMLVGDSITKGFFKAAEKHLEGTANCARLATSACVSDPAFFVQLKSMFSHYQYEVVHFNNGLHGFDYSEEEYRKGYEKALKMILRKAPNAKIVLALSTPLLVTSVQNRLNSRIDERNRIVRELATKYGMKINDLHALSKDRPEYYKDPYHFKPAATELQGKQVGKMIEETLGEDEESIWPLSFSPPEATAL